MGCDPMKVTWGGRWLASFRMEALTLPTSVTSAPGDKAGPISRQVSAMQSTGVAITTKSAPLTASAAVSKTRAIPFWRKNFLEVSERDQHVRVGASCRRAAPKTIDPPMRPAPTTAICLKRDIF